MRALTATTSDSGRPSRGIRALPAAVLVAVVLAGATVVAGAPCPGCAEARTTNGWCDACGVGYVGDVPIRSKYLWEILDAHGHELNLANLGCTQCDAALEVDGYCPKSRIGFVDRKAYFSRLTWLLARSERHEIEEIQCPVCRENFAGAGWCEQCGIGRVGRYALDDRGDFDNLVHDLEILDLANAAAERCEHCAVAIVTDTECPFCRIRYEDGQPAAGSERPADPDLGRLRPARARGR